MYVVIPEEIKAKSYKEAQAKLRELKQLNLSGHIFSVRENEYTVFVDTISQHVHDIKYAVKLYEGFKKLGVNSKIKRLPYQIQRQIKEVSI